MSRLHNAWLIVCLAGLGAGCATMFKMYCSNIASRNYTFVPGKKDGLVVVSFTDPGSCSTWCYRDLKDTNKCHEVSVRSKGGGKAFYSQEIYHDKSVMYALVLPEGDYEFYGWGRNSLYSATEFSIQFKSTAGKAQYGATFTWKCREEADLWFTSPPSMKRRFRSSSSTIATSQTTRLTCRS